MRTPSAGGSERLPSAPVREDAACIIACKHRMQACKNGERGGGWGAVGGRLRAAAGGGTAAGRRTGSRAGRQARRTPPRPLPAGCGSAGVCVGAGTGGRSLVGGWQTVGGRLVGGWRHRREPGGRGRAHPKRRRLRALAEGVQCTSACARRLGLHRLQAWGAGRRLGGGVRAVCGGSGWEVGGARPARVGRHTWGRVGTDSPCRMTSAMPANTHGWQL